MKVRLNLVGVRGRLLERNLCRKTNPGGILKLVYSMYSLYLYITISILFTQHVNITPAFVFFVNLRQGAIKVI